MSGELGSGCGRAPRGAPPGVLGVRLRQKDTCPDSSVRVRPRLESPLAMRDQRKVRTTVLGRGTRIERETSSGSHGCPGADSLGDVS